jgi:hypothetical protein
VASRPEQRIVCIGHLDFFRHLVGVRLRNCGVAKYEWSPIGWRQHAVSEVAKSVVQQWGAGLPAETDSTFSHTRVIAASKRAFTTPNTPAEEPLSAPSSKAWEAGETGGSWLSQVTAKPKKLQQGDKPEAVAAMLFEEILSRVGAVDKGVVERKDLTSTMRDMGFESSLVQRLVSQVATASRSRKSIAELNVVSAPDFVSTVCQEQFWKVRDLAMRKRSIWRDANDTPSATPLPPRSVPASSRYSGYAGVGALLLTPGVAGGGPLSDGLGVHLPASSAFDRHDGFSSHVPGSPQLKTFPHPKDASLHMHAWEGGEQEAKGDEGATRRPLSALSVVRPASAQLSASYTAGTPAPFWQPDAEPASKRSTFATATPMLSRRLGLQIDLCLEDNGDAGGDGSGAGGGGGSGRGAEDSQQPRQKARYSKVVVLSLARSLSFSLALALALSRVHFRQKARGSKVVVFRAANAACRALLVFRGPYRGDQLVPQRACAL